MTNRSRKLNGNEYKQILIRINDKYIKEFLLENDFDKKSLLSPTKVLSKIPDELKHYFFRGLIDGDGCPIFNSEVGEQTFSWLSQFEQCLKSMHEVYHDCFLGIVIEERNDYIPDPIAYFN